MATTTWTQDAGMTSPTEAENVENFSEAAEASKTAAAASAAAAAGSATSASGSETTASTKATESAASAAASNVSAAASEVSNVAAGVAKVAAETAETNAEAAQTASETAKTASEAAKVAAETAETNAEASETAALSSKNAAATSAATASTKATESATSATASEVSNVAAGVAKVAAEAAETNAETAQAAAETAKTGAETAKTAAETAQTASETAKTASETAKTASETAKTAAETAETNAGASEAAALSSKNAAATSAGTASTKATESAASATASEASKVASVAAQAAAETAETNAETAQTASETAKTASEAAKVAAETAETNAATSATTATTQAGISTTKAGEASTSATSAAASATSASASKDAALAALDSFDDRYLGQKAADPTVDNDGDALVSGALYFNTTTDSMMVYEGSAWVAAYASLSGALLAASNLSDVGDAAASRTNLGLVIGTNVQAFSAVLAATTASYTTAEETKLAGIEASADVTDTANVVAALTAGTNVTIAANGTISSTDTNTVYTHPTHPGDDFSVDTGALTGATVVSDIDINVATDGLGHVTDANGSVATRTLTLSDLGYTGATNATANVGDITGVTAGNGLTGGGTSGTVTLNHSDTSSQSSVNNSGRTYIQDITLDTYGHITGISSATETVVNTDTNTVPNNATITLTAGNALSGGGNFTTDQSSNETITINHSDTSSQASVNNSGRTYIQDITLDTYGHITGISSATETVTNTNTNQLTTFVVEDGDGTEVTISQGKEWKFVEGGGIDINWTDTSTGSDGDPYDLTIKHVDTSSQASVNNSGRTYIQDITLDTYGHITGISSATETVVNTDTNTTYSAGTNLSLSGTTFNLDSTIDLTEVHLGSEVQLRESTDRADLLQITSSTSTWGGLQIRNSSNEGRWSFMTDGSTSGFYDDENSEWAVQMAENGGVTLSANGTANFTTGTTYMEMARHLDMNNYDIYGIDQIFHHGDTNTYMQFHAADQWRVVTGGTERLEVTNSQITAALPIFAPYLSTTEYLYHTGDTDTKIGFPSDNTIMGYVAGQQGFSQTTSAFSSYKELRGYANVIAYYSDERLKTRVGDIENAVEKVKTLDGFYYVENDLAKTFGYDSDKKQVALSAQDVQKVLPEAVTLAPFDMEDDRETGETYSKSGENYLTVDYAKMVPLLVEAIKEQQRQIDGLEVELSKLRGK